MLTFKDAGFNSPTDLRAGINKWNTASLFINMRYISIIDYDRVIFRCSCDTFALRNLMSLFFFSKTIT